MGAGVVVRLGGVGRDNVAGPAVGTTGRRVPLDAVREPASP